MSGRGDRELMDRLLGATAEDLSAAEAPGVAPPVRDPVEEELAVARLLGRLDRGAAEPVVPLEPRAPGSSTVPPARRSARLWLAVAAALVLGLALGGGLVRLLDLRDAEERTVDGDHRGGESRTADTPPPPGWAVAPADPHLPAPVAPHAEEASSTNQPLAEGPGVPPVERSPAPAEMSGEETTSTLADATLPGAVSTTPAPGAVGRESAQGPTLGPGLTAHPGSSAAIVGDEVVLADGLLTFLRDVRTRPPVTRIRFAGLPLITRPLGTEYVAGVVGDVAVVAVVHGRVVLTHESGAEITRLRAGDMVAVASDPDSATDLSAVAIQDLPTELVALSLPDGRTAADGAIAALVADVRVAVLPAPVRDTLTGFAPEEGRP